MTCKDIYDIVLSLLVEEEGRGDTTDLIARFLPLLNAFCFDQGGSDTVRAETMEEPFPLEESFAYSCAFFVASLLCCDENDAQASRYLTQSDRLLDGIRRRTKEECTSIQDKYGSMGR